MKWAEIAISNVWKDFWASEEVQKIEAACTRLLENGNFENLSQFHIVQARLRLLRELREMPRRLAERDAKIEMAELSTPAETEQRARVLTLPRID